MGMCKNCRLVFNTNDMTSGYCSNCLKILKDNIIICSKCKTINKNTSKFCKECGNKFEIILHKQNLNQDIQLNEKQQFTVEETEKQLSVVKINDFDEDYFTNLKKEKLDMFKEKQSKSNNNVSNVDELLKWANLLEKGLISQEEFNIKKEELF